MGDNSGIFKQVYYPINPGLQTFPWLSNIAAAYESYRFHKLVVKYIPTCSSVTSGSVNMFLDYDASDNFAPNELWFRNNYGAVSGPSWDSLRTVAPREALTKGYTERYIRDSDVVGDIKTYDIANLFVGVEGQQGLDRIGSLYIEYDIEFKTPQMKTLPFSTQVLRSNSVGNLLYPFNALINNPSQATDKGPDIIRTSDGGNFFANMPGYLLAFAAGAGVGVSAPYITAIGNAVVTGLHTAVDSTTTFACNWFKIYCPDDISGFRFQEPGATSVTHVDLEVSKIDEATYAAT